MTNWSNVKTILAAAVGVVFPAAQLVVLDEGTVVFSTAVGAADEQTLFDLASLTKPLATTTLAMQLIARGALSLDDQPRPGLSVRALLSHSSGLPAWKPLGDSRAAILEAVRREPLAYPTGSRSIYSDLGFILLGDHLERTAQRSLAELFAEGVAAPLGIETRYGPVPPERAAPCEGYRGVVHDDHARAMGGVAGHAGLFSTARDVAAIACALLAVYGGAAGIVDAEELRRFWSPSGVPGSTWCLGWDRPSQVGSSAGAHWPKEGVGHLGFTGTSLWLDPPRGRGVILLSNRVEPTRKNERIKSFRPLLHEAVIDAMGRAI